MITLFYVLAYWVVGVICTVAIIRLTNDVNVEDMFSIALISWVWPGVLVCWLLTRITDTITRTLTKIADADGVLLKRKGRK